MFQLWDYSDKVPAETQRHFHKGSVIKQMLEIQGRPLPAVCLLGSARVVERVPLGNLIYLSIYIMKRHGTYQRNTPPTLTCKYTKLPAPTEISERLEMARDVCHSTMNCAKVCPLPVESDAWPSSNGPGARAKIV